MDKLVRIFIASLVISKAFLLAAVTAEYDSTVFWANALHDARMVTSFSDSGASEGSYLPQTRRILEEYRAKRLIPAEAKLLVDCIEKENFKPYYEHIKAEKITDIDTFFHYWLPGVSDNTRFLSTEVFLSDPFDPKDHTLGAFKEALFKTITDSELEFALVPDEADHDKLLRFKRSIEDKILCEITCFIAGMELSAGWYIIDESVKFWDHLCYTERTGDSFINALRKIFRDEIQEIFREKPSYCGERRVIADDVIADDVSELLSTTTIYGR